MRRQRNQYFLRLRMIIEKEYKNNLQNYKETLRKSKHQNEFVKE